MSLLCEQVPCFGQVVVVDETFEVFSRAWCLAETVNACQNQMPQELKIHSTKSLKTHSSKVKCLDVRDCEASRPEDKAAILARIEDVDYFNKYLHDLLLSRHNGLLVEAFQHLAGYALWWDGFSNDYLIQLSQREHHVVPLCTVAAVPTLVSLAFMIFPLRPPGQGWQDQSLFWCIYNPAFFMTCTAYLPFWVKALSGMEVDVVVCVRHLVWYFSNAAFSSSTLFCIAVAMDAFPVP